MYLFTDLAYTKTHHTELQHTNIRIHAHSDIGTHKLYLATTNLRVELIKWAFNGYQFTIDF